MTNKLQEYFPMIQTRESIMEQIEADRHLKSMFEQWGENHRQDLSIKISRKSTQSSYLSRAHGHSISFQIHISTILNRNPIPG